MDLNIKLTNQLIGIANIVGAISANISVSILSRRALFLSGQVIIMVSQILMVLLIHFQVSSAPILTFMMLNVVSWQNTNGTIFFIYASEVMVDSAIGLANMLLMILLIAQSLLVEPLLQLPSVGVKGIFLGLAVVQALTIVFIYFFVKETKGLNSNEKKGLYKKKAKQ